MADVAEKLEIVSFYKNGECLAPFQRQPECHFYIPCKSRFARTRSSKCKFYAKYRFCKSTRARDSDAQKIRCE